MPVPWVPAAVAAAGSLIGGERANRQTREMAREQMAFQERMSNTSYQRSVEDMKLAGINPMLAYQQGGASSPGGAGATMQDVVSPAVSSAQHARRLSKDLKLMDAQIAKTVEETRVAENNEWMTRMQARLQADLNAYNISPITGWDDGRPSVYQQVAAGGGSPAQRNMHQQYLQTVQANMQGGLTGMAGNIFNVMGRGQQMGLSQARRWGEFRERNRNPDSWLNKPIRDWKLWGR